MNDEDDYYIEEILPGELPECDLCQYSITQCEAMTSATPCKCSVWREELRNINQH